jgi:hypothetical protein
MGAFGSNFPDFRAIWLGTTKTKLQNLYEVADQNIRTFTSTEGNLRAYDMLSTNMDVLYRLRRLVLTHYIGRLGAKQIFRQIMLDIKIHLRSMRKPMRAIKIVSKYPKSNFPPF